MTVLSPDGRHHVQFELAGRIHEEPSFCALSFYKVSLNGRLIQQRSFGDEIVWSDDSRFFALEEWFSTDQRRGPSTALFVVDVERGCYYDRAKAPGGFIIPMRFEGSTFIFKRSRSVLTQESELDLDRVVDWHPLWVDDLS